MKKLIFLSIAAMFLFTTANAQLFQYGIKAGVNFSTLAMDDIMDINTGTEVYDLVIGESVTGYQVGVMTRINIAMFFVQPELYFNAVGGTVQKIVDGGATDLLDVNFNRFDIPLLVGVKLGPARLNAGPVGTFVIGSTNDLISIAPELETLSNDFTWGFQAGIGLDLFKKLAVDLRYEGSLSKYGDTFAIGANNFDLDARPSSWIISLGYWF